MAAVCACALLLWLANQELIRLVLDRPQPAPTTPEEGTHA